MSLLYDIRLLIRIPFLGRGSKLLHIIWYVNTKLYVDVFLSVLMHLGTRHRYSVTLCYNTFSLRELTEREKKCEGRQTSTLPLTGLVPEAPGGISARGHRGMTDISRRSYGMEMPILCSRLLPRSSGAYMASMTAGRALKRPGRSARRRWLIWYWPMGREERKRRISSSPISL